MQQRRRPAVSVGWDAISDGFRQARRPAAPARRPAAGHEVSPGPDQDAEEGLYIISVAARILRMHPQTLRKYERAGLVRPSRTEGMLRLYSERDIMKLRMIKHLVDEMRLNLAGVEMALAVFERLTSAMDTSRRPERPPAAFERAMEDILDMFAGRSGRQPAAERQ